MIRSMTGYGRGSVETGRLRVTAVARSVNHRFADVRLRVPGELAEREADLRRAVLGRVQRGRVDLEVKLDHLGEAAPGIALNRRLVERALAAARELREQFGLEGEFGPRDILSLPGILQAPTDTPRLGDEDMDTVREAVDAAVSAMDAERIREGEALGRAVEGHLESMAKLIDEAGASAREVPKLAERKLRERLEALTGDVELDPWRLAQEVAILADRADVSEELERLRTHVRRARELLDEADGSPVGKRLDFLLQEIHREANTLNSKCSDLEVSRHALGIRAEGEKVREQIQNVE